MSARQLVIRSPADDAELHAYAAVMSQSLSFPPLTEFDWPARCGIENIRVGILDGEMTCGLVLLRMGQWFGGRRVPMTGISAVGVAPHQRASGIGSELMGRTVEEIHAEGVPLSALYPATQPVYRRCGYEQAGLRLTYRIATAAVEVRDRTLGVRPLQKSDYPAIHELYRNRARRTSGNLDRIEWCWRRCLEPRKGPAYGYVVTRNAPDASGGKREVIEGYVCFIHKYDPVIPYKYDLEVLDLLASTPAAAKRLLSLFADHRSVADYVYWGGAPVDPFMHLLAEQKIETVRRFNWMLRIVDVRGALASRGYPNGLRAEVHLEVRDDVLKHNTGRFVLEIADGRGQVREGGEGSIRLDVQSLAPIYTGYISPVELSVAGGVEGDVDELISAGAAFAGPVPWLADNF